MFWGLFYFWWWYCWCKGGIHGGIVGTNLYCKAPSGSQAPVVGQGWCRTHPSPAPARCTCQSSGGINGVEHINHQHQLGVQFRALVANVGKEQGHQLNQEKEQEQQLNQDKLQEQV